MRVFNVLSSLSPSTRKLLEKVIRRAMHLRKEDLLLSRRRMVHSMASCLSYHEYDRFHFGLADDLSLDRGPLEVRNPRPADSNTRGTSHVCCCPLHEKTWEEPISPRTSRSSLTTEGGEDETDDDFEKTWEEPIAPQTSRFSLTTEGGEHETDDDFDSQSSCDTAPAQTSCYPSWNGAGSHPTVVEEAETSDRECCSQSISQPFLPEQPTPPVAPPTNRLFVRKPIRTDNLPLAFRQLCDSKKEVVDTEDNLKPNSRFEVTNDLHHQDGILTPRTLNKTKSNKVVPTTLSNPEKSSHWKGSPTSEFQHVSRGQNHDLDRWDTLNSQTQEPIELPPSSPRHIMRTLPPLIPSIVLSPPSSSISRIVPPSPSAPSVETTPPRLYGDTLLHSSMIPEHVIPDPVQRHRVARRMRTLHGLPSHSSLAPNPAEANTNYDSIGTEQRALERENVSTERHARYLPDLVRADHWKRMSGIIFRWRILTQMIGFFVWRNCKRKNLRRNLYCRCDSDLQDWQRLETGIKNCR